MESADGQPGPSTLLIQWTARWHPQECPSTIGLSRFDPKVEVELPWIPGSTIIHLKVSTDLLTAFSTNETHVPLLQPPWEANQGPTIKKWWNLTWPDAVHDCLMVQVHQTASYNRIGCGGSRSVASKGVEGWSRGSLTWHWISPYSTSSYK
jgi:hypothetical protein